MLYEVITDEFFILGVDQVVLFFRIVFQVVELLGIPQAIVLDVLVGIVADREGGRGVREVIP